MAWGESISVAQPCGKIDCPAFGRLNRPALRGGVSVALLFGLVVSLPSLGQGCPTCPALQACRLNCLALGEFCVNCLALRGGRLNCLAMRGGRLNLPCLGGALSQLPWIVRGLS